MAYMECPRNAPTPGPQRSARKRSTRIARRMLTRPSPGRGVHHSNLRESFLPLGVLEGCRGCLRRVVLLLRVSTGLCWLLVGPAPRSEFTPRRGTRSQPPYHRWSTCALACAARAKHERLRRIAPPLQPAIAFRGFRLRGTRGAKRRALPPGSAWTVTTTARNAWLLGSSRTCAQGRGMPVSVAAR